MGSGWRPWGFKPPSLWESSLQTGEPHCSFSAIRELLKRLKCRSGGQFSIFIFIAIWGSEARPQGLRMSRAPVMAFRPRAMSQRRWAGLVGLGRLSSLWGPSWDFRWFWVLDQLTGWCVCVGQQILCGSTVVSSILCPLEFRLLLRPLLWQGDPHFGCWNFGNCPRGLNAGCEVLISYWWTIRLFAIYCNLGYLKRDRRV